MYIKKMFERRIDRDIQGVIKVGQENERNVYIELDEYVVTKELEKHFRDFFTSYEKSIDGHTDKMGVWISGFFGSGKSHFLKILSYLLENREVKDREAIDFFIEDNKIRDEFTKGLIEKAASIPTDVILFNIDSKSDTSGVKNKDSILNVFLKVFNEMQGYSTNPHLAHLERSLDQKGLYNKFKNRFQDLHKESWTETRHTFNFYKSKVEEVLIDIGFMSKEDAEHWSESTIQDFEISIEEFASLVKDYIDSKEENHHVVFLVDEIGQYIGDDTDLMLNLQTITEDLGRVCQGKAWVVVTSQQDIDSMTQVKGNDFSKIQGRFDTRLSLTSANVDEVIKLRILKKTKVAEETLKIEYAQKETIMKNLIIFNDTVEKKGFESVFDFVDIYPFVPYQSDILAHVLTSIRRHGASGKHLSEGERSMLALYKQSAETIMDKEFGNIVPFNLFYDALERFLDHSHAGVIKKALENNSINPHHDEENFNVNILKTLFMIKYVDEIAPNVDNITTLMVSHIDEDRRTLKEKVQKGLQVLEEQMLIQRHGEYYIFLTDEEQEINREIQNQNIEESEINKVIQENIFGSLLVENKISIDKLGYKNRYNFDFDKIVDGVPYRTNRNADLSVHIITPLNKIHNDIISLNSLSLQDNGSVIVNMDEDKELIEEITTSLKIEKFLHRSHGKNLPNIDEIYRKKSQELRETRNRIEFLIENNLKSARFFVNTNEIQATSSNFKANIISILSEVANEIYNKLEYIDSPKEIEDIQKLLTGQKEDNRLFDDETPNKLAVREVMDYIQRTSHHTTVTFKNALEQFSKKPFGYTYTDIQWIISYLYVEGDISLDYNGERISLYKQSIADHMNYLTKTSHSDRLVIKVKEAMPEHYKQSMRQVSRELFSRQLNVSDSDEIVRIFRSYVDQLLREVENLRQTSSNKYPGYAIIEDLWKVLMTLSEANSTLDLITYVHKRKDVLLDLSDDYDQVNIFFTQGQKIHWDEALENQEKFFGEQDFLDTSELEPIVQQINTILEMEHPYGRLRELPDLNHQFTENYIQQLEKEKEPLYLSVKEVKESILKDGVKDLTESSFFEEKINSVFEEIENDIKFSRSIRDLNSIRIQIDIKTNQAYEELNRAIQNQVTKEDAALGEDNPNNTVKVPIKRTSMKRLLGINQLRIETEEDVKEYITVLKKELEKELSEAKRVIIKL